MLGLLSLNLTHVLTSDEKNCSSGNEQRAEIDTSNIRLGFVDFLPLRNPSGQYQDFRYTLNVNRNKQVKRIMLENSVLAILCL